MNYSSGLFYQDSSPFPCKPLLPPGRPSLLEFKTVYGNPPILLDTCSGDWAMFFRRGGCNSSPFCYVSRRYFTPHSIHSTTTILTITTTQSHLLICHSYMYFVVVPFLSLCSPLFNRVSCLSKSSLARQSTCIVFLLFVLVSLFVTRSCSLSCATLF
jgi:hypothetical protein